MRHLQVASSERFERSRKRCSTKIIFLGATPSVEASCLR
ncbi:hypothetical protein R2601_19699 [Salipiger bermudensis HTCC2601]|uniref:Uncharacterized protein n=1 Tax=Salipiger bermudensis (strain DSM 26914 / JCM 13377 / KCTC 12554 / HTCC2601) TaxID=314265 RepID=Q0FU04_SALBH|nr:hypothetical protein R2601_19699 [Salipiger bermudensis HTCC2601]